MPFFQRKLVGHLRSVIGVIQDGDYVWSIDGMGEVFPCRLLRVIVAPRRSFYLYF